MSDVLDQQTVLVAQGLAFGFLNRAFYEPPSAEFINRLAADDLFADWPLSSNREEMHMGLHLLRKFCSSWQETELPALRSDYGRLFIGPGPLLAPPWESVYLSDEHLLFEAQTLEVREMYRRFGLQAPKLNVEPDDHLGLEMAFMVHLCHEALAALEHQQEDRLHKAMQAQRDFMEKHLLRWAPDCLWRVIRQACTDYYRGVAYLALGCLAETVTMLGLEARFAEVAP